MADQSRRLPVDPAIVARTLPNGLACWHYRSRGPGFAVALVVDAGALDEDDGEEGIAHFLEHLAFQGGGSPAALALRRKLERRGARLGRSLNATTGLEQTSYLFSVPGGGRDLLLRCLGALAEIAGDLHLDEDWIERERRVILEEMPLYEGEARRLRERALALLGGASRLARRHPLGLPDTVAGLGAREIAAFHRRCYRPGSARLLIASAQPPAQVAQLAESAFGGWSAGSRPPRSAWRAAEGAANEIFRSRESERGLRFYSCLADPRPEDVAAWQARLARESALWLFNRRLELLGRRRSALARTALGCDRLTAELSLTLLRADDLQRAPWRIAIAALAGLARRAGAEGFSPWEAEEARRALARRAAAQDPGARPPRLEPGAAIARLLKAAAGPTPPMSAEQQARLLGEAAAGLDGDQLLAGFHRLRAAEELMVAIVPQGSRVPSPLWLQQWRRNAVAPRLPEPGPPPRESQRRCAAGAIVERSRVEDPGFETWRLGNGIVFHALPLEQAERPSVALRLAAGRLEEARLPVGSTVAACWRLLQPRLFPELRRLIEDGDLRCRAEVEEEAIHLEISMPAAGAAAALELIHRLLLPTRPGAGELAGWRRSAAAAADPGVAARLARAALELLSSGDRRFRPATAEEIAALDRETLWQRRREVLARPLELAIAGPLPAGLEDAVRRWLGSLPPRSAGAAAGDPLGEELRRLPVWRGPLEARLAQAEDEEQGGLLCGWRGPEWSDTFDRRRMHLAAHLLEKRLFDRLRLQESLTYGLTVAFSPNRAYPAASLLTAALLTRPAHLDRCRQLIEEEIAALRRRGPTEEERLAATRHFAQVARRALATSRFWARNLAELGARDSELAELSRLPEIFAAIGREELAAALARHLDPVRQLIVSCDRGQGDDLAQSRS